MLSIASQPHGKTAMIINVVKSVLTRLASKLLKGHNGHNVGAVVIDCVKVLTSFPGEDGESFQRELRRNRHHPSDSIGRTQSSPARSLSSQHRRTVVSKRMEVQLRRMSVDD